MKETLQSSKIRKQEREIEEKQLKAPRTLKVSGEYKVKPTSV